MPTEERQSKVGGLREGRTVIRESCGINLKEDENLSSNKFGSRLGGNDTKLCEKAYKKKPENVKRLPQ